MWHFVIWFLGIFKPKRTVWEKEVTPKLMSNHKFRLGSPKRLSDSIQITATYDPVHSYKWEVAKLIWPDESVRWMALWTEPEWREGESEPIFNRFFLLDSEQEAKEVVRVLNKNLQNK